MMDILWSDQMSKRFSGYSDEPIKHIRFRLVHTFAQYPSNMSDDRFGLLVRCNPKQWKWYEKIPADGSEVTIDWTCKLKPGSVPESTPVWVLGTGGTGFIASGHTTGDIRETEGDTDSSWADNQKHRGGRAMRLSLKLRRNVVADEIIRGTAYEHLIRRQSTFTWLTEEESFFLEGNLD